MATLNLIITTAGQAAIAQAGSLGPVVISKVAIGSGTWSTAPTPSATALLSEIKQLDPSGSETPSPGIIHITATDNSTDVYNVYEMGLYTSTGILFAIAGGTTLFLNKASGSSALFSIDLAITNVPSGSVVIGDAGFAYPPATETTQGVAEIATSAEVAAGLDDTRIVTPKKLADGNFLSKSGGTMTGAIVSSVAPTVSTHLTNKAYVDGTVAKNLNGYHILPNGLIMQWGFSPVSYNIMVTFPIPFPNSCFNVTMTCQTPFASTQSGSAISLAISSRTNANFVCQGIGFNSSLVNGFFWQAIGY